VKYTEINSAAISQWAENGWEWGQPVTHDMFVAASFDSRLIGLTPQKKPPREWYTPFLTDDGRLDGCKLLGLASGGGQQIPLFSALGASCTVLDYSDKQLESERMVAAREGYAVEVVKADMTLRLPFNDDCFDLIFHPVSNCYIEDVQHVWNECFRVLKPGGVLLAGTDNGVNYVFEDEDGEAGLTARNKLPYNPLKDPALMERGIAGDGSVQFSHTIEEQVGGQLKAGFILTDLFEDTDNDGIGEYMPNFLATRAVKPEVKR